MSTKDTQQFVQIHSEEGQKILKDLKSDTPTPEEQAILDEEMATLKAKRSASAKKAAATRKRNALKNADTSKLKQRAEREAAKKGKSKKGKVKSAQATPAGREALSEGLGEHTLSQPRWRNIWQFVQTQLDEDCQIIAYQAIANTLLFSSCVIAKQLFDEQSGFKSQKDAESSDPFELRKILARTLDNRNEQDGKVQPPPALGYATPPDRRARLSWQMKTYEYLNQKLLGMTKDNFSLAMEPVAALEFLIRSAGKPKSPIPSEFREQFAQAAGVSVKEFDSQMRAMMQNERQQWIECSKHIVGQLSSYRASNRLDHADEIQSINIICKIVRKLNAKKAQKMSYMFKFGRFDQMGLLPILDNGAKLTAKFGYAFERYAKTSIEDALDNGRFVDNIDDALRG